jgi:2-alkenal reductase
MDVPVDRGLLILEAVPGGPADRAGVRGGDRIVRFGRYNIPLDGDILVALDGQPMRTSRDLTLYLDTQAEIGQEVALTIIRDGEEQVIEATLAERPQ